MCPPQRLCSQMPTPISGRLRTPRACDRCRLKKNKCDGLNPCSKCKRDNAICVSSGVKKSHDKIYPKGYAAMLERNQDRLVLGLQELYHRLVKVGAWNIPPMAEADDKPTAHDILQSLGLLNGEDSSSADDAFSEGSQKLQSCLSGVRDNHVYRQGSVNSDAGCYDHTSVRSTSSSDSGWSNLTMSPEQNSVLNTTPLVSTRSTMWSSHLDDQQEQSSATQLLPYLLRYANDQRAGVIEPIQAIKDLDNGLQATQSRPAVLIPNLDDDSDCIMDFKWDEVFSSNGSSFYQSTPYTECWGATAFAGVSQDITDMYLDYSTYCQGEENVATSQKHLSLASA